jgi:hypothetical protein
MQTRFSLLLLCTIDREVLGYPAGVSADVLAEFEELAPHLRRDFVEASDASVRAVGLIPAGTPVAVLRHDHRKVVCKVEDKVFSTVPSTLRDDDEC